MNLGIVYKKLINFEKAIEFYESAIKIEEKHYGKGHIQTAIKILNLGVVYDDLGNLEKAKEL
jgi:tetratricopeptide (TPR) repeat protein